MDSVFTRPSITSRLLGKRKASFPKAEQPDTKRSTLEAPGEWSNDADTPTTSPSASFLDVPVQSTSGETSKKARDPESSQSELGHGTSSSNNFDSTAAASDAQPDMSVQQNQSTPEEVVLSDDADSSDEVDICDAPPPATPKKDTQVTGICESPKSSPGVIFPRLESRNASPVPCHYCPKTGYRSAVKTCLVCGASMCTEHLRPHLDSPVFQNHTLVPPMEDISTWRCQEHQEINRIYCRQCGVCVCTVCTVIGSHRDHICISIREAEREMRVSGDFAISYTVDKGCQSGEVLFQYHMFNTVKNIQNDLQQRSTDFNIFSNVLTFVQSFFFTSTVYKLLILILLLNVSMIDLSIIDTSRVSKFNPTIDA